MKRLLAILCFFALLPLLACGGGGNDDDDDIAACPAECPDGEIFAADGDPGDPARPCCIPACTAPEEYCDGTCYASCPTGAERGDDCRCSDPQPLAEPQGPPLNDRFCLSARVPTGMSGVQTAYREWFFERLAELGIARLRHEVRWAYLEPQPGEWNFAASDLQVAEADAHGVELIALLGYGNTWASEAAAEHNDPFYPPDDSADFASFAGAVAERYGDSITRWEIWNEQNAGYRFWKGTGTGSGDPTAYAALLRASSEAIHDARPAAIVSYGGLFYLPQIILGGEEFLRQSLQADPELGTTFQTLSYHPYSLYPPRTPPEEEGPIEDTGITAYSVDTTAERMQTVLVEEGAGERPLWVTEVGWPNGSGAVTEHQQAQYLVRTWDLLAQAGVELLCWYTFSDGDPARDYLAVWEEFFGLYTWDRDPTDGTVGQAKPVAEAWRILHELLGESRPSQRLEARYGLGPDVRLSAWIAADGTERLVAWSIGDEQTIAIPARAGEWRQRGFLDETAEPLTADANGVWTLTLTPDPLYIVPAAP